MSLSNCTFSPVTNFVVSVENIAHLRLNLISTQLEDRGYDKLLKKSLLLRIEIM